MEEHEHDATHPRKARKRRSKKRLTVNAIATILALYIVAAYLIIPLLWEEYEIEHPSFDDNPRITTTSDGHPGDPVNIAIIGSKERIEAVMRDAAWREAAALGILSDLKIAEGTILSRPDATAPVSSLYLFGRKEDLAFEKPVGDNPRQRHHVRLWDTKQVDKAGRPIWMGAASYDDAVGFSHTTGQITHHIAADVDAERDHLLDNLKETGRLAENYVVDGFHKVLEGRNGGGDPWQTDGDLYVVVIEASQQ